MISIKISEERGVWKCTISQHQVTLIPMGHVIKARTDNHWEIAWFSTRWELCDFSMGISSCYKIQCWHYIDNKIKPDPHLRVGNKRSTMLQNQVMHDVISTSLETRGDGDRARLKWLTRVWNLCHDIPSQFKLQNITLVGLLWDLEGSHTIDVALSAKCTIRDIITYSSAKRNGCCAIQFSQYKRYNWSPKKLQVS